MNLLDRFRRWLGGVNECPRCGKVDQKMSFGATRIPCPGCWDEANDIRDFIEEEQEVSTRVAISIAILTGAITISIVLLVKFLQELLL